MAESFQPSTQWRERVEPDEERRFAGYADHPSSTVARVSH